MSIFGTAQMYESDKLLFERLGLQCFVDLLPKQKYFAGRATFDDGSWVDVWVEYIPAVVSWTVRVYSAESSKTVTIETGSGSLTQYWEIIQMVIDGMLVITSEDNRE